MKWGKLGTAAVIVTALAAPTPAVGAGITWTVNPSHSGACSSHECASITDAVAAAASDDIIEITPGTYAESVTSTKALTFKRRGTGLVRIVGDGSSNPPFALSGAGTSRLQGLLISSSQAGVPAVLVTSGPVQTRTVEIDASILTGKGTGAGLAAATSAGDAAISITADHVTVADSGSAPATSVSAAPPMSIGVTFTQSIVRGSSTGAMVDATNDAGTDMGIFVNAGAEDFHLRAHTVDENQGGTARFTEADVDGDPRSFGGAVDKGADEFVNHPPVISSATATPNSTTVGQSVQFGATASDPDPGDSISYSWIFGDGGAPEAGQSVSHAYAQPGFYTATVTVKDSYGQIATSNVGVTVSPAPSLAGGGRIGPLPKLGAAARVADLQ
ncbi:MAG: PKD domain-containing protein, partial [Actinomycetota bacterium]|nr:PKD domain-containing protein [Actinomycetota bacterium]